MNWRYLQYMDKYDCELARIKRVFENEEERAFAIKLFHIEAGIIPSDSKIYHYTDEIFLSDYNIEDYDNWVEKNAIKYALCCDDYFFDLKLYQAKMGPYPIPPYLSVEYLVCAANKAIATTHKSIKLNTINKIDKIIINL